MTAPVARHEEATVAITTALPLEFVAMKAMLDDPQELSTAGNAPGEYVFGTIPSKEGGRHGVVLALCSVGENLAAANTSVMLERFPRISSVIMVGIAGGVPDPDNDKTDVRLGDVVVCSGGGAVQYDYDKESLVEGQVVSETRHPPRPPSPRLLEAARELEALTLEGKDSWRTHIERPAAKLLEGSARPTNDVLHHWEAPFPEMTRKPRPAPVPRVFSGVIASGNKLLKNASLRERLRKKHNAQAVEMEASGVADASWLQRAGYFVVRGVCDYCDAFKNDEWQQYAAIVAAAYARGLLERTRAESVPQSGSAQPGPLPEYALVPPILRSALEAEAQQHGGARAYSEILNETLVACRAEIVPIDTRESPQDYWPALVLDSLAKNISTEGLVPGLAFGELLLGIAFPSFVAAARKLWVGIQFDRPENEDWLAELNASMASTGQFSDLSEGAQTLLAQSAVRRITRRRQAQWRHEEIRASCVDTRLARWMAADPHVCALLRATAGDMTAFQNLPETAEFRLGDDRFEVRWRHLACVLCLSELRVLGVHLLPPDVLEALVHLADVDRRVSEQLRMATIGNRRDDWVLRATCDEPALDHMLVQSVRVLNEELHRRGPMSDHLTRAGYRAFPHVTSEVSASLINGAPRYTVPHVSFSLSANHARKLFMGTDLWGNPEFAYRELFQNALDACRYRKARSQHLGLPYEPLIRIFHGRNNDGTEYVECEDNGIGMDRSLIASCFAIAGNRFVETEEYRKERDTWRAQRITHNFNSQFGIGVFSYFLVAEELEVETSRLTAEGEIGTRFHLTVPTASSFFRIITLSSTEARAASRLRAASRGVTNSPALDAGTRVRLTLRRELHAQDEMTRAQGTCVDALRRNVWFSEVRAEIEDYRGGRLVLESGQLTPWIRNATKVDGLETPFWWLATSDEGRARNEGKPAWIFRSRTSGNKSPDSFRSMGRVLVDGIVTESATPGFIINLAGKATPKLSLDRREIRSDIRDTLEEAVTKALAQVPMSVSKGFLEDLWQWDPRACHQVSSEKSRKWHKINWSRAFEGGGLTRDEVRRPYLPPFPEKPGYVDDHTDASTVLVELWKIATATPEARDLSKFVLESRGLSRSVRPNLHVVPTALWVALAKVVLGVPEALAVHVGFRSAAAPVIAAYVSWQTGEPVAVCAARLASFAAFLGEAWAGDVPLKDEVVDDYEAWLLGFSEASSQWAGPEITTYDVCRFCARSGQTEADAVPKFDALTQKLGWTMNVDCELVKDVGIMNDREARFAALLHGGFGELAEDLEEDKLSLLCRLVDRPPPIRKQPQPGEAFNEEQQAIAKELRWAKSRDLSLAEACSVARKMSLPLFDAISAVREVGAALGRNVKFDEAILAPLLVFSDNHWKLAEGSGFLAQRYIAAPSSALELAKRVATWRHLFWRMNTAEVCTVLSEVYAGLQWGEVPLDEAQVASAMALTYEQAQVLERVGSSGHLGIPRLVMIALDLGRSLPSIAKDAEALAAFGIKIPSATDSYLGVAWSAIDHDEEAHHEPQ